MVLHHDEFLINEHDIPYEEELLRNPYSLRPWIQYIEHKKLGNFNELCFVYERALKELPGSYKLWKQYLDIRREKLKGLNPVRHKQQYNNLIALYEHALILLNKMPRIWLDYLSLLTKTPYITKTRHSFDNALRALPVTQHQRIWEVYLQFAKAAGGETAIRIYRRYLKFEPGFIENYIESLIHLEHYNEAAVKLVSIVNDTTFKSQRGKSHYQLWQQLCELAVDHCDDIHSINVEAIIRSGIKRFSDQVGILYSRLAMYWIRMGQLEKARDVFEEGITTVMTVRDFTVIFDAYAEFEEEMITTKMEMAKEREDQGEKDEEEDLDLDMRLMRFEQLMDRRPFLVNDVLLRQNPNNVMEWQQRVTLWRDNKEKVVETYTQAVQTINPKKAHGKFHELWANFAKFYEDGGDLESARKIFDKAVKVNYKSVNDLAEVWCEYAEMETRHDDFDRALEIMARATEIPKTLDVNPKQVNFHDESIPVQLRLFKSLRLWSFYIDLEESVGTVESTKAVYDKVMDLRIVNPQTIVNYATFLEENQYFEESFKVYERGIELFGWPIAFEIWNIYLDKFLKRYGGTKLERARDLFEQALDGCPPKYAKPIYLMYGKLEEEHGLARHAMRIYDRATRAVADEDRMTMFEYYIAKATESFGIMAAREIYERAIEALPDKHVRIMALRYAELERKLGEIDRARAIYGFASQLFNPRTEAGFWKTWHDFEVQHGNEDTFKEMLRIKRSVQAAFPSV
ncbi:pre-mRNA splicing factor syf-1 [Mycotypha africana]|uniref:pre-mRNA splicing factor syf-1 n=1 Tax=Mycotypha africana TaxID=64632 RepID=UPI00230172D3|nr:pre-mRNA splicing factor syf-1 [Mycotypha africana]KAI8977672.1 pre-mRNA splicing factor syf-1 [Mycotypha africana]